MYLQVALRVGWLEASGTLTPKSSTSAILFGTIHFLLLLVRVPHRYLRAQDAFRPSPANTGGCSRPVKHLGWPKSLQKPGPNDHAATGEEVPINIGSLSK